MLGTIHNSHGEVLDYTFHPGSPERRDIVVIGHGVTGNKDRPFLVALAEGLAAHGHPALRFSFSGNGNSGGRFEECTISKEVEDLSALLRALHEWEITYIGHSMGAAVGVLRSSQDSRISGLVSLAGMVHTEAFAQREFGRVTPGQGFMWEDSQCPLSSAFMEDMRWIHTVADHGPKIHAPWLFVHGTSDDVVPFQDSLDLFARANEPKELVELKGANHVFADEALKPMIASVLDWVEKRHRNS